MLNQLLILASEGAEGIPGEHIAAKLAVPLAIVIFCGSVYLLLWSNYGAKKGAAIYGTAMFGFCAMLGVFWWFGAPGTPVATGLQNFPGQPGNNYAGGWHAMEPGSARAEMFPVTNSLDDFQTLEEFTGNAGVPPEELEGDPGYAFLRGDLDAAGSVMLQLYLPTDANGNAVLGGERRTEVIDAAEQGLAAEVGADAVDDYDPAVPFLTARVRGERPMITESEGLRVAGAELETVATYVNDAAETVEIVAATDPFFAFKDPGAIWFPSAVWTGVSLVLFLACLFALDRLEQREKRERAEVEEPEDVAVPVAQ